MELGPLGVIFIKFVFVKTLVPHTLADVPNTPAPDPATPAPVAITPAPIPTTIAPIATTPALIPTTPAPVPATPPPYRSCGPGRTTQVQADQPNPWQSMEVRFTGAIGENRGSRSNRKR